MPLTFGFNDNTGAADKRDAPGRPLHKKPRLSPFWAQENKPFVLREGYWLLRVAGAGKSCAVRDAGPLSGFWGS